MSENETNESEGGDELAEAGLVESTRNPLDPERVKRYVEGTGEFAEPEPEPEFYRCKKGHVTEGLWVWVARETDKGGEIIAHSGPICRICWCRWMAKMFPAKKTQPRKKSKAS